MPTVSSSIASGATIATARAIAIVIADDHRLFRAGLRQLLASESDLRVVGEAADGDEAVDVVRQVRPDVLLLDLCMPRRSGLEVLRALAAAGALPSASASAPASVSSSAPRAIVLAGAIDDHDVIEALQLGAQGIVSKDCATAHLFKSIRAVANGECWIGRERVGNLVRYLQSARATLEREPRRTRFGLTTRELQVISALVAGETNRDIAQRFSLSQDTVKHHLTSIFDKCGVSNRLELAMFAVNHHVVETV